MNHETEISYNHGGTRLDDGEGLLVVAGAVYNLQGMDFAKRQAAYGLRNGHAFEWELLDKPKYVSGVGDNAKACARQATVPGCLEGGTLIKYSAPAVGGSPSPAPPFTA